jgi:hypothetical protein
VYQDHLRHTCLKKDPAEDRERLDRLEATIAAGGTRAAMMFDPQWS